MAGLLSSARLSLVALSNYGGSKSFRRCHDDFGLHVRMNQTVIVICSWVLESVAEIFAPSHDTRIEYAARASYCVRSWI